MLSDEELTRVGKGIESILDGTDTWNAIEALGEMGEYATRLLAEVHNMRAVVKAARPVVAKGWPYQVTDEDLDALRAALAALDEVKP